MLQLVQEDGTYKTEPLDDSMNLGLRIINLSNKRTPTDAHLKLQSLIQNGTC